MSFLGRLFGSDKALEAVVDGVSNGLDKLVYTDEEKQEAAAKERTEARSMLIDWMKATQGQNLSRRVIALSITAVWLLQFIVMQVVSVIAVFADPELSVKLSEVGDVMAKGGGSMGDPVMLILAFYFAAPHMSDIARAVTGRFKK